MNRIINDNRGIALIVVILMISLIVALTLQLNMAARSEIYSAANVSDGIKLLYVAKSGFGGAEGLLAADDTATDTLTEDWAQAETLSLQSEKLFAAGRFSCAIVDEAGKIPINRLVVGNAFNPDVKDLLIRFLSLPEFNLKQDEVEGIVDAIKDWIDADEELTGGGAESSYYGSLRTPYSSKNKQLDCIDELLMIRGVTSELFYGTKTTPALKDYLTTCDTGVININTAPLLVLRALSPDMTEGAADDLDRYRRDKDNDLSDPMWYREALGASNIVINTGLIGTKSDYYQITSVGYLNERRKMIQGIVRKNRDQGTVKVLSWRVQ